MGTGDEPDDGPQHYILMLGFNQSHLIVALDAIGVHIANVIKLNSKHRQTCEVRQGQQISEGNEQSQRTSPALDGKLLSLFVCWFAAFKLKGIVHVHFCVIYQFIFRVKISYSSY